MQAREKTPGSHLFVFLLFSIPAYAAWSHGGTRAGYQPPMVWLAWLAVVSLIAFPCLDRTSASDAAGAVVRRVTAFFKDPFFYAASAFLLLLLIQWWNARWPFLPSDKEGLWIYKSPRVAWLPSSVTADEGREMLRWFFPAFAAALCVRHAPFGRRGIRLLYWLMAINAALVAFWGIVQFLSSAASSSARNSLLEGTHTFAGFGYANHAGSFFVLTLCAGAGLVPYYMLWRTSSAVPERRRRGTWVYWTLTPLLATIFLGAQFSLSRSAVILSLAAMFFLALAVCGAGAKRLGKSGRLYLFLAVSAVATLGGLFINGYVWEKVEAEFAGKYVDYSLNAGGRLSHVKAAAAVWRDNPWFGVGGWGYRYYVGFYVDKDVAESFDRPRIGAANAHNDAMQFLAEFGVVGFGLLAVAVGLLAWPVFRHGGLRREIISFPALGIVMALAQSMIDLPFRCPAVLSAWFILLAAAGEYARSLSHDI